MDELLTKESDKYKKYLLHSDCLRSHCSKYPAYRTSEAKETTEELENGCIAFF